jgi:hypothetical protein
MRRFRTTRETYDGGYVAHQLYDEQMFFAVITKRNAARFQLLNCIDSIGGSLL